MSNLYFIFIFQSVIFFSFVYGDHTMEDMAKGDKNDGFGFKIGAIFSILLSGAAGVVFPTLVNKKNSFKPPILARFLLIVKSFSGGVILATAFVHLLPDSVENLTSAHLISSIWPKFPFYGLISMLSTMVTLIMEGLFHRKGSSHDHQVQGGENGSLIQGQENLRQRNRLLSQVLEVGIIFHSIIIGISLGASRNPNTVKPLMAALSFHQLFEGLGLGECLLQAQFNNLAACAMMFGFSVTTPIGVAIGMGIAKTYNEDSSAALITEGILNSISSGILIYMSLVDILAEVVRSQVLVNRGMQVSVYVAMLLGASTMAILAIWA